ncbi:YibE/F family protein, partial [Streptomyces barringtoniae]|uniref:YibE/F family protein n=1 Tax=Streptomyces barringtoniae TaxID=2892029 RepID=UPI001E5A3BE2
MGTADRQSAGDWNRVGDPPRPRGGHASGYGQDYEYGNPPESVPHPGYGPDAGAGHIPSPAMGHGYAPATGHEYASTTGDGPATATAPGHGPDHGPGAGAGGHGHGHSHGHSHSHGPAAPVSRHLRKVIAAILIPFTAAVVVGLVVLWPGGAPPHKRTGVGFDQQTQQATVTQVVEVSCKSVNASGESPTGDTSTAEGNSAQQEANGTCHKATVRVDTGKDKGRTFTEIVQPDQTRQLHQGEKVVTAYEPSAPKDLQYSVTDVNRHFPMGLLAGIFALAVVLVGRLRGVMALVALAISFLVLNFFILPAALQGSNPLLVA